MARVVITNHARERLLLLISTLSLPASTRDRVRRAIAPLADFPRIGPRLVGRWDGFRFLLGPWPWMVIVYTYDESVETVFIVTIEDARSGSSPTAEP